MNQADRALLGSQYNHDTDNTVSKYDKLCLLIKPKKRGRQNEDSNYMSK
jgi:hypothetical protein